MIETYGDVECEECGKKNTLHYKITNCKNCGHPLREEE